MKIVSSGRALHSPEFFRKKKRNKRIKLILLGIGAILLITLVIYLFHNERFLIKGVKVNGDTVTDSESIASIAREHIEGSYLAILPRANTLIYPKTNIRDSILRKFPRLKSVALSLEGLNILTLKITERVPKAIYCADDCFFVDEDGFIFDKAPAFSDGVYLVFITSIPIESPVGKTLMSKDDFVSLSNFAKKLTDLNVYTSKLEIREDEYALILHNRAEIIWRASEDLNVIYSNLQAFLSSSAIKSQPKFLDRISRLDLRTENKIFYRFRSE